MSRVAFARVRRYLPRMDAGRWGIYFTGAAAAMCLPALLVQLGLLVELLASGGSSVPAGTWLGRLQGQFPQLEAPEHCLLALVIASMGLAGLECLFLYLFDRSVQGTSQRLTSHLRSELRRHAFHLGASELLGPREATPAALFAEYLEHVRQGLVAWWRVVPHEWFRLALLAFLAIWLHVWLALAAAVFAVLFWWLLRWLDQRTAHRRLLLADRASLIMALLVEGLRQVRLVKGYQLDDTPGQPFDETLYRYHRAAIARDTADSALLPFRRFVVICGFSLIVGMIGVNLLRVTPSLTLSHAVVLCAALTGSYGSVARIARLREALAPADRAAAEVLHYLHREPGVMQLPNAAPLKPLADQLELVDVTLLDGAGHKLLDEVSLRIPAGARAALVSLDSRLPLTVGCLLPRFYDPHRGRVMFDRQDARDCTLQSLRSQVAVLAQEGLLFTGSVEENIRCGDTRFTAMQVHAAARLAQAFDFIHFLPQGFDTIVGEHGIRLTADQQFRIGLARALLRDPAVLVLEEPDGDFDSATTDQLDRAIAAVSKNRTVLLLPKRLNTLRQADRLFLFHEGRLTGEGTHLELVQASDLYRHLIYVRFNEFRNGKQ